MYPLAGLEAKSLKQVWQGAFPLRALGKKASLPLSFRCHQQALAFLGLWTHGSTLRPPLALSLLCSFPSLTKTLVQGDLEIFILTTPAKTLLPNKVPLTGSGRRLF